mgnify:FL=1
MKKYYLLDYKWQKIGFAIIVFCIVLVLVFYKSVIYTFYPFLLDNLDYEQEIHSWVPVLFICLLPTAFALIALSQEKIDDERIKETRHQVLARMVIIYILAIFVRQLAYVILTYYFSPQTLGLVNCIAQPFLGITAFMGYYILFFKLSLWKQNKELSYEE